MEERIELDKVVLFYWNDDELEGYFVVEGQDVPVTRDFVYIACGGSIQTAMTRLLEKYSPEYIYMPINTPIPDDYEEDEEE